MKKFAIFFIIFILFFVNIPYVSYAQGNSPEPNSAADSAVLIDGNTGTILYSKNPDTAYPPASTTKIMTNLLVFEKGGLDTKVTIGKVPASIEGSSIGLREGEEVTVRDLLYGLNLQSGNDCAYALAEYVAGSADKFVELMNAKAKELGATNTNFVNPCGLYNKDHKTSAHDLALFMKALVQYKEYQQISQTIIYKMPPNNKVPEGRTISNEDKLITKNSKYYYKDAIAGKTGYTIDSLFSYTAAAERNGQLLIVAFVHSKEKSYYDESKELFDYGFNNFSNKKLFSKGDSIGTFKLSSSVSIPVTASQDFLYTEKNGDTTTPVIQDSYNNNLSAKNPIKAGDVIGKANILLNNAQIGTVDLLSSKDYTPAAAKNETSKKSGSAVPKVILAIAIVVVLLRIRAVNIKNKRYLARKRLR
ncbi:D-alanyl-D-alanine carboxypeptidase [Clostridium sp. 19966]|uniref:D-alanyl-D-alanine carboxypeptidase family protein n=1 Tax=Clostridium sp. 19966 TaxID=2768166 RepID=UPI0028DEAE74|nr:D-alanyl-D-alanine carboxypeptidase family protein [Clostridium sp. 19966]MDT8715295.1 D-alanyl-D-alanine carboxypeptidase [Clostridium sp. 19966]